MSKYRYEIDENGYVTFYDVPITKVGVFPYRGSSIDPSGAMGLEPDKIYNVYRPQEEVEKAVETFKLQPWLPKHEMIGDKYSSPESVGVQGTTGENPYFQVDTIYTNLKLFGRSLKKAIKKGLEELSCGFGCSWHLESGVFNGTPYEVVQRNITGNHLASVQKGRMGSDVSVAMDRAIFALDHLDININQLGDNMDEKQLQAAIAAALAPLTETVSGLSSAMDGMSKDMEGMKQKAEDMEKGKAEDKAKDMEMMKKSLSKDGMYKDGMSDKEVMDAYGKMMKAKDEKEKSKAMDEALKPLIDRMDKIEGAAQDAAAQAVRSETYKKASALAGAFDHKDMTVEQIAAKGCEAAGVACDGAELAVLDACFTMRQSKPATTIDFGAAQDSKDAPESLKGVK